MDRTFTQSEFHSQVFNSNKLNTDFLDKWNNKSCVIVHAFITSPLVWAAVFGHLDIVKYLVENGADIMAFHTRKAIDSAISRGYENIAKYLLNTNGYSEAYIHQYVRIAKCHIRSRTSNEIVELLINYKQFSNTKACR